jgi:transcriptional regulator with XRE-family HTH domain
MKQVNILKKEFGHTLTVIRKEIGLTQIQLSKKSGLDQAVISRLENGEREPSWEHLLKLAKAIDASIFLEFDKKKTRVNIILNNIHYIGV